jgi:hypothetical protein
MGMACRGLAHLRMTQEEFREFKKASDSCMMADGTINEHQWMAWLSERFGPLVFVVIARSKGVGVDVVSPEELASEGRINTIYSAQERTDLQLLEDEDE